MKKEKKHVIGFLNNKKIKPKRISLFVIIALGIALMPTSLILGNIIQDEIDKGIAEQVEVPDPDDSKYDEWENNNYEDAPEIYTTYYLWNLTNPDEYLAGDKPIYEEIGPFVFREYKFKYNVDFNDAKSEVTFKEFSNYVQVNGDNISEVKITNLNPAFLGSVATAGGTDMHYNQMNFPFVLSQLKEEFNTIFTPTIDETLSNHTWIEEMQREIMEDCDIIGFGDWLTASSVADIFFDCLTLDDLETFLRGGMPSWEETFYEEWANDYFPEFDGDYAWLANQVEYTGGGILALLKGDIEALMKWILNDPWTQVRMNAIITKEGAELVDRSGSKSNLGVDVEYNLYNVSVGSEADLNISTTIVTYDGQDLKTYWQIWLIMGVDMILDTYIVSGGSGLTFAQCDALWNESNPNSLTGLDYEANKIWFDAAEGDTDAKNFLMTEFVIDPTQLDYILKWINTSTSTWVPNAIEYTVNSWNSGVITTRTVEEWLYTANDTGISNYMRYYGKDPDRALINIFDNCHNTAEAERAEVGTYTIKTGRDDISEIGQTVEYNGQDKINIWVEPEEIEGTDGLQFAPGVSSDDTLKTFQPDLMRVVDLEYKEDTEIYDIDLLRYELSDEMTSVNPNYYMNTQGLVNLAPIEKYEGIAIRVSKPHLLGCDYNVQTGVAGMRPNGDLHDTNIDIEPITGIVMSANKRIQINVELWQTEFFLTNISNVVMPILWYEQGGEIPEDLADIFKDLIYGALELKENVPLACIGIGAAICIPGVIIASAQAVKGQKLEKLTNEKKKLPPKNPFMEF